MPSPFPGMNPYVEREEVWHDFHERFIPYAAELLTPQVRPHYIVRLDENIYVHELPTDERELIGRPDIAITRGSHLVSATMLSAGTMAAPASVSVPMQDEERLTFIEIVDRGSNQLVTAIELLSPANKGSHRQQYESKRERYLSAGVTLVEIDLLRGGRRLPLIGLPSCAYYVLIARAEESPRAGAWPVQLRDPLPKIPIPLRAPKRDAELDLQSIVHRVYDAAGYEDYVYSTPPTPPLTNDDAQWAAQFLPKPSK